LVTEDAPSPGGRETPASSGEHADALLFATAPAAGGGPAALLDAAGTTVLARLLGQLEGLGAGRVTIVTRPAWSAAVEAAAAESPADAVVLAADDVAGDLRTAAGVAAGDGGALLLAHAHLLAHREALAGLLCDPRIASGVLAGAAGNDDLTAPPVRSGPARVLSAGSPYHRVSNPTGSFLGAIKVAGSDRRRLAHAARELAGLRSGPVPEAWEEELRRKRRERELGEDAWADDALALLLVGLVRSDVELVPRDPAPFVLSAPRSQRSAGRAAESLSRLDESRLLLDSVVKTDDSPFTTYLVSPYSKRLARLAARAGLTPDAVSVLSLAVGVAAAASFALGSRAGLVAGAILLQASFTLDCVDGQLARYTRRFSSIGAWLDAVFDRTKEYLVYAGLAVGSARGFDDDVWVLAAAALALQTVRHMADFAYGATRQSWVPEPPALPLDRADDGHPASVTAPAGRLAAAAGRPPPWLRLGNQLLRLPIGERFLLISVTAAIATPRVTFVALLAWGAVAAVYSAAARIALSSMALARLPRAAPR
jgi:hypothetical protein